MAAWTEKPPILTGKYQQDIQALRDYLFRMAGSLTDITTGNTAVEIRGGTETAGKAIADVKKSAEELRSLIIKSAGDLRDEITEGDAQVIAYTDSKTEIYDGRYLAVSDFGTFEENLNNRIENTARGVVESFNYEASINSMQDTIDLYQTYFNTINGEIRRGIVEDPDTHEYVIGIVISQAVQFTGSTYTPGDGFTYWEVAPDQTFGIYTATGWQFWINGTKRGWFSSQDSMLHVSNIFVESSLHAGADWVITFTGGFGIKYTGA